MSVVRALPDLLLQLLTLAAAVHILRKWNLPRPLRLALGIPAFLVPVATVVIVAEMVGFERAFRWLWIPGVSFIVCLAFWSGLALRGLFLSGARLGGDSARSGRLPSPGLDRASGADPGRRQLLRTVADASVAVPAAMFAFGILNRRQFRLVEADLPIPGLHRDLDGLRLVQLSDIHLSPFLSRADLAYCVDMANETRADVAFVTGDLIIGIRDSIDDCLQELSRLRSSAGVYGCNGNHEMYIEAEGYTADRAARRGMKFLRQERTMLRFGDATINLAGVDHQGGRSKHLSGAENLLAPADLNLLLSHTPAVFPTAARQGWDVTLSGHMHGGQINLELQSLGFNVGGLNVGRIVTPYVYGAYHLDRSSMYVTRGIGTVGIPVRLGAPPEVALIRLRPSERDSKRG